MFLKLDIFFLFTLINMTNKNTDSFTETQRHILKDDIELKSS